MKHLKLSLLLVITLLMSGCTKESVNESIEIPENKSQLVNRSITCNDKTGQIVIHVTYNITTEEWQEDMATVRINFRNRMSNHFTIYSVFMNITPGCQHTEVWNVDCAEYLDYINDKGNGTGGNQKEGTLKESGNSTTSCFN